MKKGISHFFLYICVLLIILVSCKGKNTEESTNQEAAIKISGDTVLISENSSVKNKLNISAVTETAAIQNFSTTGTVRICSGSEAQIVTPFEGIITKTFVKLGSKVSTHAPLFEINSAGYHDAVGDYLDAQQQKQLSLSNFQRKKDLCEHGVASKKELEEAETEYNIAEKGYEKSIAALNVYGVDPEKADVNKPLTIKSPIAGEVVKNEITVGQYLTADSDPVAMVADLDNVWVVARVKEKDLSKVKLNNFVCVTAESDPENPIAGTISYIGNIMDEQTRSVEVYIKCPNENRELKANMFVSVGFSCEYDNQIVVPNTAILQNEEKSYLFVAGNDNTFIKREIVVTTSENNNSIVLSGLSSGEKIVMNGGIYLH